MKSYRKISSNIVIYNLIETMYEVNKATASTSYKHSTDYFFVL